MSVAAVIVVAVAAIALTARAQEDDGGRDGAAAEWTVARLPDARDRLYDKIHDLLDALRRAFLDARRVTRTRRANRTKPSIASSMVTRPTFERSMMAMSFLMFGVFVIRVVQRLVQTLQRPGGVSPSSPDAVLPAALAGLF